MDAHQVLIAPVQSEKAYMGLGSDKYVFKVHPDATKPQVRAAVEATNPGVTVLAVRTATVKSKPKRRGWTQGRKPGWKKAVVQLKAGDSISIFEGVH